VHNQIIQQAISDRHGTVIKTMGDAFLVNFPSVVHAVQCAQQIQSQFQVHNAGKEKGEQIHVRIGIHSGDIVQKDSDVFGDGVNIASRLQGLAEPDTICFSHVVYQEVEKKLPLGTVVSLGQPKLKNIAQRFQVYALLPEKPVGFHQRLQVQHWRLKQWRRPLQVAAVLVLLTSAGLIGHYFYVPTPAGLVLPDKPSIVVLPFANMSNDSSQDYFSDGLTEDITTGLAKISSLFIIARNSAFTYKGKAVKVQDVSREMGVQSTQLFRDLGQQITGDPKKKWATLNAAIAAKTADFIEYDVLRQDKEAFEVNMTSCRLAEFFKLLNEPELGALLACEADFDIAGL